MGRVEYTGRPPEDSVTLVRDDPTWELEYEHFSALCRDRAQTDLSSDLWLNRHLRRLAQEGLREARR